MLRVPKALQQNVGLVTVKTFNILSTYLSTLIIVFNQMLICTPRFYHSVFRVPQVRKTKTKNRKIETILTHCILSHIC